MSKSKKGIVSISIVYTFLILFILTLTGILHNYLTKNNLISNIIINVKEEIYAYE